MIVWKCILYLTHHLFKLKGIKSLMDKKELKLADKCTLCGALFDLQYDLQESLKDSENEVAGVSEAVILCWDCRFSAQKIKVLKNRLIEESEDSDEPDFLDN